MFLFFYFVGYYVYIEISSFRRVGDIVWLVSSIRLVISLGCINFWYNMKGWIIDIFIVYLVILGK